MEHCEGKQVVSEEGGRERAGRDKLTAAADEDSDAADALLGLDRLVQSRHVEGWEAEQLETSLILNISVFARYRVRQSVGTSTSGRLHSAQPPPANSTLAQTEIQD